MRNSFFATVCCMAMLAGCQQAEEIVNPSEELTMVIEASIEDQMESRYVSSDNTPNNLSFATNESVGVFVNERPAVKWTYKGNSWEPETTVYWPDKSEKGHDFYAFYPYAAATSKENVPMPSLANQTGTIESLSACDFLVATTKESYGEDGIVSFTGEDHCFKHVSELIAITVKGESDLSTSTIKTISFGGNNIASNTTYSFTSKTTSVIEGSTSDMMTSAYLEHTMDRTDKTFYFIVNGGNNLSTTSFTIEYSTGEKNYTATKPQLGNGILDSGKQYSFNVKVADGVMTISGNEIQDWTSGGTMDDIVINGVEQPFTNTES